MVSDPNQGSGSTGSTPGEGSDAVPGSWAPPGYDPPAYTPPSYTPPAYPAGGGGWPPPPPPPGGPPAGPYQAAPPGYPPAGPYQPSSPAPPPPLYGAGYPAPGPSYGGGYPAAPPPPPGYGYGGQAPPGYGYGGQAVRTDGTAVTALVLSIASFVFCPIVLSIVALALIPGSRSRIAASGGMVTGNGLLNGAKWTAIANIVLYALIFVGFAIAAANSNTNNNALGLLSLLR